MTDKKTPAKPRRAAAKPSTAAPIAPIAPTIVPSSPQLFAFAQLRRAPENVRHTRIDEDVPGLADDIAAHGLLQSLIGYAGDWPEDQGRVFVVGGGRRFQALTMLEERGLIAGDFPVPVLIRDKADAIELSLAENLQQRTMSPVDEFFAFRALMENGTNSPATLAARFGFSERVVKQRLRLADLDPEILDALAARTITIDAAMAYASSQDIATQRAVFKSHAKPSAWQPHDAERIRRDLRAKGMDTGDALYRFVGPAAYEAAGGGYEDDLFNESGTERILTHAHLVETLAHEAVNRRMPELLPDMRQRTDLAPTISGWVKVPDLRLMSWGTQAKLTDPAGFLQVKKWDHANVWKTIRNNRIDSRVLVGVNASAELEVWPGIVFVETAQKEAVDPTQSGQQHRGYVPLTPEQRATADRDEGIETWSKRLAIGPFADTPLDGRAFWPTYDHAVRTAGAGPDGKLTDGWLVPVNVFVTDAEIAAQLEAAAEKYDSILADRAARDAQKEADDAAAVARKAELANIDPPAVVVVDGQPWILGDDGYAPVGDDQETYGDWEDLLDSVPPGDIGETYPTRAAYDAALQAAQPGEEVVPAELEEQLA